MCKRAQLAQLQFNYFGNAPKLRVSDNLCSKLGCLKIIIYLAASGLSYSMWGLHCGMWDLSLRRVGFSLVVAHGLSCTVAYKKSYDQPR